MTKLWTRIAIGAAAVGTVALATYFWMPVRNAAASMMGGGMMGGGMATMMQGHMQGGDMSAMMESHMKDGKMATMMEGHMKDGNMSAMMDMMGADMTEMMSMMGGDMMANMDTMHEAMAPMHQKELEAAAKVLGLSVEDLTKALSEGKTADAIAQERNVDPALIAPALAEVRASTFAELVANGTLTQDQANKMQEHMKKAGSATLGAAAMMQGESCHSHMAPKN